MDERLLLSFAEQDEVHWWFVARRRIVEEAIASATDPQVAEVLEVGCGTGGLLPRLKSRFPDARIAGIEPNAKAVDVCRQRGCLVEEGSFDSLERADGAVDLLIALDVLEHCEHDDLALAEALRVLRPGGVFIATVPALMSLWGPHDEINAHFRRYTAAELRAAAEKSGLKIRRLTYFNSLLLPLAYLTRWFSRWTGSQKATGVGLPPRPVNQMLQGIFALERPLLRRFDLPIGMSLLMVAERPAQPSASSPPQAR